MTHEAPLFALGRILIQPDPFPLGSELDSYLQRHAIGDQGLYGKRGDGETSGAPIMKVTRASHPIVSLYRTPLGWLWIRTGPLLANGKADARTETWCLLLAESWEGPFDVVRPYPVANPH